MAAAMPEPAPQAPPLDWRSVAVDPERRARAAEAEAKFDFQQSHVGRAETEQLTYRLSRPIAAMVKLAARRWGSWTAGSRAEPDFLVIGAKRAGSTTLYRGLVDAGDIAPMFPAREQRKGVYYFDVHHAHGDRWYRGHMPRMSTIGTSKVGEASPYYLSHPHAASRAAALLPNARVVAVLRDPVERAHSHYRERWKQGVEFLPDFDTAIAAEADRLDGEEARMAADPTYVSWNHLNFGYLAQSRYATNLGRWLDAFGDDRVLVMRAEDLYADGPAAINQVREFIGLPPANGLEVAHHNKLEPGRISAGTASYLRGSLRGEVQQLEQRLGRTLGWPTS